MTNTITNCAENIYYIFYTDSSGGLIAIPVYKTDLDPSDADIALVGKTRLEYGELFNENMLHILEHFASKSNTIDDPNYTNTFSSLLENPVIGQLWYNSTYKVVNVCVNNDPIQWRPLNSISDVSGNSGVLYDGETIPLPVSRDGYTFNQSECVWHVSPYNVFSHNIEISGFNISANNRLVNCKYTLTDGQIVSGSVNYIILGVKGSNNGVQSTPSCPTPTPTPTISLTPSVTRTPTKTPTITPTISLTPSNTRTPTPTPTVTNTPGVTSTPTPTPTVTPTITPTPSLVTNLIPSIPNFLESFSSAEAYCDLQINSDGTWTAYDRSNGTRSGRWLNTQNGYDYEFLYTYNDMSNPPAHDTNDRLSVYSPMPNIWVDFPVRLYVADSSQSTEDWVEIDFTIRNKFNHDDFIGYTISMHADGSCFAYGTQIKTKQGFVPIETITKDQLLYSFTIDGMIDESYENWGQYSTDSLESMNIITSYVKEVKHFAKDSAISINGAVSTLDHVYLIYRDSKYIWENARNIKMTDKLVKADKTIVDIESIEIINQVTNFVALDVENVDTLIIKDNNGNEILTHNMSA